MLSSFDNDLFTGYRIAKNPRSISLSFFPGKIIKLLSSTDFNFQKSSV